MNTIQLTDRELYTLINALRFASEQYARLGVRMTLQTRVAEQFDRQSSEAWELADKLEQQ